DSSCASVLKFCRTQSASRNSTRPRSCAVVCDQPSNAARAAATARSTSCASQSGTSAIGSSVEGSRTGNRAFATLSTHSPLIRILSGGAAVVAVSAIRSSEIILGLRCCYRRCASRGGRLCDLGETSLDDVQSFVEFGIRNHEWRQEADDVAIGPGRNQDNAL